MYNFKKLKELRRKATTDEKMNGSFVRDVGVQPKDPQTAIQEVNFGKKQTDFYKAMGKKPLTPNKVKKPGCESVDHSLQELSKYKLSRYQMKAADDLRLKGVDQGAAIAQAVAKGGDIKKNDPNIEKRSRKMNKRVAGIGRAANKLTQKTNEETLDEMRYRHGIIKIKSNAPLTNTDSKSKDKKEEKKKVRGVQKAINRINEDGHADVASALRKCKTIMEDASDIHTKLAMMGTMDSLPSWWTNKLAVAAAYMDSMRDYLLYPTNEEVKDQKYLKKLKQTKDQATLGDMSTGMQKGGFQGRGMYEAKKVKTMKKVARDKLIGKKDPFEPEPNITTQVIRTDSPDNVVK